MADRLISADKLKAHYAWWEGGTREMTMGEAKKDFDTIIDLQSTIEAEPKHGHWIDKQNGRWIYAECSRCKTVHDVKSNYCPNCGAKMDEVDNG